MKKILIISIITTFCFSHFTRADEGMWLASLLKRNYADMKKHGLNLTPEQIYDINNASIKDAIVSLGGFCTAEVVSYKGLLLTNHHCGYDAIASSSTEEHNYLRDGFWAKSMEQEIPIEGLTASFIVRIENVSEAINALLTDAMSEQERDAKIREISKKLTDEVEKNSIYEAYVRDFYEGNEFYLFVTQTYKDLRLVGAPPSDIGKFGYDTDNWVWPRHTGDFSMFRIYAGKDNLPAKYNESNVPYKPKHALPISIKGVKKGDFTMILGFPGSTDRYLSSFGVKEAMNVKQPKRVELRRIKLDIMDKYMRQDEQIDINYASKHAQVANYWKYFIGQSTQLKNNHVVAKKQALEKQFTDFASTNKRYENVIPNIENAYQTLNQYSMFEVFVNEAVFSVDVNLLTYRFVPLEQALKSEKSELIQTYIAKLKEKAKAYFATHNNNVEGETILAMYNQFYKDVPKEQQSPMLKEIGEKSGGDFSKYIAKIRKKSIFFHEDKMNEFLAEPSIKALAKDPLYALVKDFLIAVRKTYQNTDLVNAEDQLEKANRLFVEGLQKMNPDKLYYPNANSTLRLTYGNVLPYEPRDAVKYGYTTTMEGIIQKELIGTKDYKVPSKLKTLWENKDFGQYAGKDGKIHVNFLSNTDITGGNSGSPVINGDGQLIGIAFDGNWEAMSGDIYFEPELQRTISVDIRYVLFIIDKYAGAQNLIDEMNIIQ